MISVRRLFLSLSLRLEKAGEFFVLCVSESGCVYQWNGMIAHKRCFLEIDNGVSEEEREREKERMQGRDYKELNCILKCIVMLISPKQRSHLIDKTQIF